VLLAAQAREMMLHREAWTGDGGGRGELEATARPNQVLAHPSSRLPEGAFAAFLPPVLGTVRRRPAFAFAGIVPAAFLGRAEEPRVPHETENGALHVALAALAAAGGGVAVALDIAAAAVAAI